MLLICQISFIFILNLYDQGDDTLTEISSFKAKWVEQKSIQTLQPGETKIMQMRMYQFRLIKS